jgi:hypothetical protein
MYATVRGPPGRFYLVESMELRLRRRSSDRQLPASSSADVDPTLLLYYSMCTDAQI